MILVMDLGYRMRIRPKFNLNVRMLFHVYDIVPWEAIAFDNAMKARKFITKNAKFKSHIVARMAVSELEIETKEPKQLLILPSKLPGQHTNSKPTYFPGRVEQLDC